MKYLEAKAKAQRSPESADTKRDDRAVADKMLRGSVENKSRTSNPPEENADERTEAQDDETDAVNATPAAISLAEELGVDLSTVTGTGADGRITVADVRAAGGSEA